MTAISDSLTAAKLQNGISLERWYDMALSMLGGAQGYQLEQDLSKIVRANSVRESMLGSPVLLNMLKRVVNLRGNLYAKPPKVATTQDIDGLLMILRTADRVAELCGWCAVMYGGNGWQVMTPDQLKIDFHNYEPDRPLHIEYSVSGWSGELGHQRAAVYNIHWTDDKHWITDEKGKHITDEVLRETGQKDNPNEVNPYGVMPFVFFRQEAMLTGDFYGTPREDWTSVQRSLNITATHCAYLHRLQAGAQPVFKGMREKGETHVGAGSPLYLDNPDADFSFISPGTSLESAWASVRELISYMALTAGLPASALKDGGTASGVALRIERDEIREAREERKGLHEAAIRQCVELQVKVDGKGDDKVERIDWNDNEVYYDPVAEASAWEAKIAAGVSTAADWLLSDNPDLDSIEEAANKVKENLAYSSGLRTANLSLTVPE